MLNVSSINPPQPDTPVTSVGAAPFDVSGDADHRQCVDAAQTEDQREESIHLKDHTTPLITWTRQQQDIAQLFTSAFHGGTRSYLTCPDGRDDKIAVLKDIEDLDDATRISENRDARI